MHHDLLLVLALLFVVALLQALSKRLKISFPILLVLAGLAIGAIPRLPQIRLDPDVVFLVFLPPLLYEAAWFTSWREFKQLRGAIALQAIGLVLVTSVCVAWVAHSLIAGMSWAAAFLLGGIISPPDAVAATSVLQGLKVPRLPVAVLEGESLINDASSLIVVRFALAAILTGVFSMQIAVQQFFSVSIIGVLVGLAIAFVMLHVHRHFSATPATDTALTLMTPYLMYLAAESVHASGVLAVVAGGLFLSNHSHRFLKAPSNLSALHVWGTVVFVLNGVVFILIGLQLPAIIEGLGRDGLLSATGYGLLISAVAIVTRILWTFPSAYLPTFLPWKPRPLRFPNWKVVSLVAWAGMRGVVSLASALAIPVALDDGTAFPHRSMIIFITFVVILVTLVFQGLSLPAVVRWLRFDVPDEHEVHRRTLDEALTAIALKHLAQHEDASILRKRYELKDFNERAAQYRPLLKEILELQRAELMRLRISGEVPYELTREKEYELVLDAARLMRE